MADFTIINSADAPHRPTTPAALRRRMAEYDGYVTRVKKGEAGKLVPGRNESARGLALRITRAGKRNGRMVSAWVADDGAVYFSVQ